MKTFSIILLALIFLLSPFTSHAKKLYIAVITVDGEDTAKESTNSILKVTEFFDNTSLEDIFPDYTATSSVVAQVDFRGVGTIIEFEQNSSELIFRIPGRNFEVRFDGGSRDKSQEQFEDWLKGEFESAEAPRKSLTRLLQIAVADSPVDPVAGNPNSLLTRMFLADFDAGTTGPFISSKNPVPGNRNFLSLGGEFGFFDAGPYKGEVFSLPINYKYNFKNRPKLSLIVDFPIILTRTETAWSYMGSLGVGAQYRPYKWWSLTPMARVGGVGSFDVGALAVIASGSLTNYFHYNIGSTRLGFGNLGGVSTTIDGIKIAGWDLSYELTNYILRNGGDVIQKMDFKLFGKQAAFKFFMNHTKFWGNELYLESFFDMGIGLITIYKIADTFVEALDFSFTYSVGVDDDYDNYGFKLTYRF